MKKREINFTTGPIIPQLVRFALPVFAALLLQSLYGAVDLLVVGKFGEAADVSAVSSGSQMLMTITYIISSFAMGITILLGQMIGQGDKKNPGLVVGTGLVTFAIIGVVFSIAVPIAAPALSSLLNAPEEAYDATVSYIRICGAGLIVIVAYNLIGSIFRGIGDSTTPLISVGIACVFNIIGDLILCAVFGLGTAGAAIATVAAQFVSVVVSVLLIKRKGLPFDFNKHCIKINKKLLKKITIFGAPIALNDMLVSVSFLIILAIVNDLGLDMSAGAGVAEKVCAFIMLVPSAFCSAMAASASQNYGAGQMSRARKSLLYAIIISTICGVIMFFVNFFFGDIMAGIFSSDAVIISNAFDYLRAYAIDCLLTCFLFCMIGYFEGVGMTRFSMLQGIVGAFCVRVPVSIIMSHIEPPSLFLIALATPCSTIVQITLCVIALIVSRKKEDKRASQKQIKEKNELVD